jgi:trehalose 6-phosphate phosphatase
LPRLFSASQGIGSEGSGRGRERAPWPAIKKQYVRTLVEKLSHLAAPPKLQRATALFLDIDGTIAEIVSNPGDVGPDDLRNEIIAQVVRAMMGRVAVLTGRTLDDVDRILGGSVTCVAAVHGLVTRMPNGCLLENAPSPFLCEARRLLGELVADHPGIVVEDKGLSLAVHYRHAPASAAYVHAGTARISASTGLRVQNGLLVSELRTAGPDKGTALKRFASMAPFAGNVPIMVGDDLTDEDAFEAAAELNGYGILVGATRRTAARFAFGSVSDVLAWLEAAGRPAAGSHSV